MRKIVLCLCLCLMVSMTYEDVPHYEYISHSGKTTGLSLTNANHQIRLDL